MELSEKEIIKIIGENIRELRLERQLSQFQLNIDSGLGKNQLGRLERGEHTPTIITLLKISKALDVSILDIIDLKKK